MRVALIAPPFIPVPPKRYGGTELFIANLAEGLARRGVDVVLYSNGESTARVENRWIYDESEWPIANEVFSQLKDINHSSWALGDAAEHCDLIHLNNAPALTFTRFLSQPVVHTLHHAKEPGLSDLYAHFPDVWHVAISNFQKSLESMPRMQTIHHGLKPELYTPVETKQPYLSFLGRIAPVKGVHLAIEVARKAGIPLKIAGEVQPMYRSYFDTMVRPHLDGRFIEYVGEADLAAKNELLGNSMAMLFPIQWNEPFGLVMIEAMACGTPVLALPGGSVPEVVLDGVSGHVCASTDEMARRAQSLAIDPRGVRAFMERRFSVDRMVEDYLRLFARVLARPESLAPARGAAPSARVELDDALSLIEPEEQAAA